MKNIFTKENLKKAIIFIVISILGSFGYQVYKNPPINTLVTKDSLFTVDSLKIDSMYTDTNKVE